MGGFSGITAASGWLISALGISIVFLGLASLAFIIYLFPYLIGRLHGQTPKSIVITLKDLFYPVKKPSSPATPVAEERLEEGDLDDAGESLRLLTWVNHLNCHGYCCWLNIDWPNLTPASVV